MPVFRSRLLFFCLWITFRTIVDHISIIFGFIAKLPLPIFFSTIPKLLLAAILQATCGLGITWWSASLQAPWLTFHWLGTAGVVRFLLTICLFLINVIVRGRTLSVICSKWPSNTIPSWIKFLWPIWILEDRYSVIWDGLLAPQHLHLWELLYMVISALIGSSSSKMIKSIHKVVDPNRSYIVWNLTDTTRD